MTGNGDMQYRHYLVSGRVQGVFYRASAAEQARQLGLHGWVRNLPDGRVEAMACGTADAQQAFAQWLREGPPAADVQHMDIREIPAAEIDQPLPFPFEITR